MRNDFKILQGSCLDVLKTLESESVQTVVTSPPYFGLRDYGTAEWDGGALDCDHTDVKNAKRLQFYKEVCEKCSAVRRDQQIGLETTVEEYVAKLVRVFSEVRRVLRKDGTLWLNLGDSYANDAKWGGNSSGKNYTSSQGRIPRAKLHTGLKAKDLIGAPWRVAFALQRAGWYLRQDIIWHKPNPMPESVLDRCTKAHEYIFLFSKSERYFFDAAAIAEPQVESERTRLLRAQTKGLDTVYTIARDDKTGIHNQSNGGAVRNAKRRQELAEKGTRNKRSVWTVTTRPYPEAHFATFPEELITPCILAGSKPEDIVLDPFSGSGTTGLVAMKHGRSYAGIELNPEYIEISQRRVKEVQVNLFV